MKLDPRILTSEPAEKTAASGVLYLVATPIGNLEDITLRALRILREADVIAAEDTRRTHKLLAHYDITTSLISYHEHSGEAATASLVRQLLDNRTVALVTDAGTPAISDPGADLVRAASNAGIPVCPIPGACAAICALIASARSPARFAFEGFLPRTKSSRLRKLEGLAVDPRTLIFYESPQRLGDTLAEMAKAFGGNRAATVARELTKIHEEFVGATLAELASRYTVSPPKGECVIVVAGIDPESIPSTALASEGDELARPNDLIKQLAQATGLDRRELYRAVEQLKNAAAE